MSPILCRAAYIVAAALGSFLAAQASADGRQLVAMVDVYGGNTAGAGVVVSVQSSPPRLFIVTRAHVVRAGTDPSVEILVRLSFNRVTRHVARLLPGLDEDFDLACLSVDWPGGTAALSELPWDCLHKADNGSAVMPIGSPFWKEPPGKGKIVEVSDKAVVFHCGGVFAGFSGGGLLDDDNCIVGLVKDEVDPTASSIEATTMSVVRDYCHRVGVEFRLVTPRGWYDEELPPGLRKHLKRGEYFWERDGSVMVYVKPGDGPSGSQNGKVPFYLDKYEVTVDKFRTFSARKNYVTRAEQSGARFARDGFNLIESLYTWRFPSWSPYPIGIPRPPMGDGFPVQCVDGSDAEAYAHWAGKVLPSASDLLNACLATYAASDNKHARTDACYWPPENGTANVADRALAALTKRTPCLAEYSDGFPFVAPVGSFERPDSVGFPQDLIGNVSEWTSTTCGEDSKKRVVFGGSYRTSLAAEIEECVVSEESRYGIGFRTRLQGIVNTTTK